MSHASTQELTLRSMGGSIGATLPKDMVDHLHLQAGDKIFAVETEKGILLTPYDPALSKAIEIVAEGARQYRNALRELAK